MDIKRPKPKQEMPSDAKSVFKGKVFEVFQWEQELFDGSTATFERLKRNDSVNVIPVTDSGKLVITKQEQPGGVSFVGALGGVIDKGEEPLDAAMRELREESGYAANEFVLWDAVQPWSKLDWVSYTFIAKGLERKGEMQLDAGEKIELIEVTFDEFIELASKENYRDKEIALKIFGLIKDSEKMEETRKLFLG